MGKVGDLEVNFRRNGGRKWEKIMKNKENIGDEEEGEIEKKI